MTIKELYDWAVEKGIENFDIVCAYADGGGFYNGNRNADLADVTIDTQLQEVEIWFLIYWQTAQSQRVKIVQSVNRQGTCTMLY